MPKFAANLTMLFNELDFLDRFEAAARVGFKGVEYLFPYDYEAAVLKEHLQRHNIVQVLHNLPAGDWSAGDRGIGCHPDRATEFQDGVGMAIDYAAALGCKQVNCLAGIAPAGVPTEKLHETLVTNLKFAAEKLSDVGVALLIEPINTIDIPGFFLCHSEQALKIIDEVGSNNLQLQYDIYHMQIMEGDLARTLETNIDVIRHIQLADNPGRHEPGSGEINYGFIFKHLDSIGYQGWIGCEYKPLSATEAGLDWVRPYL